MSTLKQLHDYPMLSSTMIRLIPATKSAVSYDYMENTTEIQSDHLSDR